MTKVEELVERVRLTDEEISEHFNEGLGEDWDITGLLQAQLNKVLNDPDLALIAPWDFTDKLPTIGALQRHGKWVSIIPLAEALKGEK